jgi:hypothetical protein
VSECLRRARRGVRGGRAPPHGGSGAEPPNIFFAAPSQHFSGTTYFRDDIFPGPHDIRCFSAHGFLPMVFYFRLRN